MICVALFAVTAHADHLRDLQAKAVEDGIASWGHWGVDPNKYSVWTNHSNRLIPIYTFGMDLREVGGPRSVYRDSARIKRLYGRLPEETLNESAEYCDQTDVFRLQQAAVGQGKRRIILVIFDGMDWQTTWAAAIYRSGSVGYREGRGTALHFQDYRGVPTDFGWFVCSPHNEGCNCDVDGQVIENPGGRILGGYAWRLAGLTPWATPNDPDYLLCRSRQLQQAVTDSASSATSMTCGIKTYNDAINVDFEGRQVVPIARTLQAQGWSVGAVTSVPISHATPACAYANNVHRDDYQDITRDLLGLPSIAHRQQPLPGMDVVIGAGWGVSLPSDVAQGSNHIAGNRVLADEDLRQIDSANGGEFARYRVVQREAGVNGAAALADAAQDAAARGSRLFGYFGVSTAHLPFQTADGKYDPTVSGAAPAEQYTQADIDENPTLADMTRAALEVVSKNPKGFWLMVEAGDVDWANHANNIDNAIGAVLSGDEAFRAITEWIESHGGWQDTAVIVTADHGHYFCLTRPEALVQ